jgi:hypothetical protein
MMDEIPAALQHKIDHINGLDIPIEQKSQRIALTVVNYWADYFNRVTFSSGGAGGFNLGLVSEGGKGGNGYLPNDKPVGPINTKFKGEQPSGWYLFGCFLCVSILSASLGAILERTL